MVTRRVGSTNLMCLFFFLLVWTDWLRWENGRESEFSCVCVCLNACANSLDRERRGGDRFL
ncbi:hypothetical protein IE53DRAFT_389905 [Violaceomyces palustris]|uniref:Uncharacterized protein n=1 Tax=Violaceomyces palustris TaxID=1673888 RepID=A0ACD0NQ23_9BASI|nr:hypothetical protein IE53DRAFT_389905 [Violaceomyces palustris]